METKRVKTVKIFLASSGELHDDRVAFADFIENLQNHYHLRNYSFQLLKWEYLGPDYKGSRKQDQYNEAIRQSDVFLILFHPNVGKYTYEELEVAISECKKRKLPLLIFKKEDNNNSKEESEYYTKIMDLVSDELDSFWATYDNNDKLHLEFLLWLDSFLHNSKSDAKIDDQLLIINEDKLDFWDNVFVTKMRVSYTSRYVNNKELLDIFKVNHLLKDWLKIFDKLTSSFKYSNSKENIVTKLKEFFLNNSVLKQSFFKKYSTKIFSELSGGVVDDQEAFFVSDLKLVRIVIDEDDVYLIIDQLEERGYIYLEYGSYKLTEEGKTVLKK